MRRPRLRRRRPPDLDAVATRVDRLAALAVAGAPPAVAFRRLASTTDGDDAVLAAGVADAVRHGRDVGSAFAGADPAWRRIGAVLGLALEAGAPLAPVLRGAAEGLRGTVELHRVVAESVAGPRASARLVLLLPPAALLLGQGLGFDVAAVLVDGPLGAVLLVLGGLLLAAAARWSRRLVGVASAVSWSVGLRLELVSTGVRAGLPVVRARERADRALAAAGFEPEADAELDDLIAFAAESGLPLVPLLDAEADRVRRGALAAARVRATVLASRLLLPLGVLVLPAFLLLGAVPIGLALLRSAHLAL